MSNVSKSVMTGHGKLTVTRSCAYSPCGQEIDAPARFCVPHHLGDPLGRQVPGDLTQALHEAGPNPPIDHPAVQAICAWWEAQEEGEAEDDQLA